MLVGSAAFTVRGMGELRYMTVFAPSICTLWVLLVLEH